MNFFTRHGYLPLWFTKVLPMKLFFILVQFILSAKLLLFFPRSFILQSLTKPQFIQVVQRPQLYFQAWLQFSLLKPLAMAEPVCFFKFLLALRFIIQPLQFLRFIIQFLQALKIPKLKVCFILYSIQVYDPLIHFSSIIP